MSEYTPNTDDYLGVEDSIAARFAAAFGDVHGIAKSHTNPHQGYAYRGIDDVMDALHGILAKHELFYVPRALSQTYDIWETSKGTRQQVARIAYAFDFYCPEGSCLRVGPVVGQAYDTDDKAPMKALSQAAKYALLQAFCIPVGEIDPDSESPVSGQPAQQAPQKTHRGSAPWPSDSEQEQAQRQQQAASQGQDGPSEKQIKKLGYELGQLGVGEDQRRHLLRTMYGVDSFKQLAKAQASEMIDAVLSKPEDIKRQAGLQVQGEEQLDNPPPPNEPPPAEDSGPAEQPMQPL